MNKHKVNTQEKEVVCGRTLIPRRSWTEHVVFTSSPPLSFSSLRSPVRLRFLWEISTQSLRDYSVLLFSYALHN